MTVQPNNIFSETPKHVFDHNFFRSGPYAPKFHTDLSQNMHNLSFKPGFPATTSGTSVPDQVHC